MKRLGRRGVRIIHRQRESSTGWKVTSEMEMQKVALEPEYGNHSTYSRLIRVKENEV
jgi:hypothetical protein